MSMRWFVTAAAVEDYMRICGENIDDPQAFHAAAIRLRSLLPQAVYKRTYAGGRFESWRIKVEIGGKMRRLDLSISLAQRSEGHADQLVAVRDNDDRRG